MTPQQLPLLKMWAWVVGLQINSSIREMKTVPTSYCVLEYRAIATWPAAALNFRSTNTPAEYLVLNLVLLYKSYTPSIDLSGCSTFEDSKVSRKTWPSAGRAGGVIGPGGRSRMVTETVSFKDQSFAVSVGVSFPATISYCRSRQAYPANRLLQNMKILRRAISLFLAALKRRSSLFILVSGEASTAQVDNKVQQLTVALTSHDEREGASQADFRINGVGYDLLGKAAHYYQQNYTCCHSSKPDRFLIVQVAQSGLPVMLPLSGSAKSRVSPEIDLKAVAYSISTRVLNLSSKLRLRKKSSSSVLVPPITPRRVVIFVSQVSIGLMLAPVRLTPSAAPQTVCAEGRVSCRWSQAAPCFSDQRKRGKLPQGVTMSRCYTFWKLTSGSPQSAQYLRESLFEQAVPVTAAQSPGTPLSLEFEVRARSLLRNTLRQVLLSWQGRNRFFHCSCALNQNPLSTVMVTLALVVQLTAWSLARFPSQIVSTYCWLKSGLSSVMACANSSPSQGSSKKQSSWLEYQLSSGSAPMSLMSATARIFLAVSLQNTLRAFFSISFQVMLSHRSRRVALVSLKLVCQAWLSAIAAQNSCPLSREGVLLAKSLVGCRSPEVRLYQGRNPPKPGQRLKNLSRLATFLPTRVKTYSGRQTLSALLSPSSTLAITPTCRDSLLLALKQCFSRCRTSPPKQSSLCPSKVIPVLVLTPILRMNSASHSANLSRNQALAVSLLKTWSWVQRGANLHTGSWLRAVPSNAKIILS